MVQIVIDLDDYPIYAKFRNPEDSIRTILESHHSILLAQQTNHTEIELRKIIEESQNPLSEKLNTISEQLEKVPILLQNPSSKGSIGEISLQNFLLEKLDKDSYNIINVSKKNHTGDIIISRNNFEVMCDAKYYSDKNVPTKEIDKLKLDMIQQNIRCGLLVSFMTGISKRKNIDMILFHNNQNNLCCLMLIGKASVNSERIILAINYLESLFDNILNNTYITIPPDYSEIINSSNTVMTLIQNFINEKRKIEDSLNSFQLDLTNTIMMHTSLLKGKLIVN